jgi:hypothetical protein
MKISGQSSPTLPVIFPALPLIRAYIKFPESYKVNKKKELLRKQFFLVSDKYGSVYLT